MYFIDPLSVALEGFDTYAIDNNQITIASLGFIKINIVNVTVQRRGGGGSELPPINIWKEYKNSEVPDLDKIREMINDIDAEKIEIHLEPINTITLTPIMNEFKEAFKDFNVQIEIIKEDFKKVEITVKLEKIEDENNI